MLAQRGYSLFGERNAAARIGGLGLCDDELSIRLLHIHPHLQGCAIEVKILPPQTEEFPFPHASGERQDIERRKAIILHCCEKLLRLQVREGRHLTVAPPRSTHHVTHVSLDQAHQECDFESTMEHPMDMMHS